MSTNLQPKFKKSSDFKGSKKKYQKKVWKAANRLHPDIDMDYHFFEKKEKKGIKPADIMTAMHFNASRLVPSRTQLSSNKIGR
ncbi:MAG: hypothetical protein EP349_04725 [Alphaproteobacteria bacterium]|nr:MAG: hypothetical protein EP349_04725 [Alphaproteobacteria bacterium]